MILTTIFLIMQQSIRIDIDKMDQKAWAINTFLLNNYIKLSYRIMNMKNIIELIYQIQIFNIAIVISNPSIVYKNKQVGCNSN